MMALETVANDASNTMEEIFRDLVNIQSLAQVLQSAADGNADANSGIYGTACVIEQLTTRAIKLTGV
jgi:hypothetical protein